MRKALVLAVALALVGGVAYANFCARDYVPAATLLFPYITVSTDAAGVPTDNGQTTISAITNVSRNAIIVHFTAWDILSIPRIDFDEVLSGYDVIQINWKDFLNGRFDYFDSPAKAYTIAPKTDPPYTFDPFEWGPDGRAQGNTGSQLTTPQNRNIITTCPNVPPYGNRSDLAPTIRGLLTWALHPWIHDGCGDPNNLRGDLLQFGSALGANPIIFYVTADVVNTCNLLFPNESSYWAIATQQNVIVGDFIYLTPPPVNASESFPAVSIEATQRFGPTYFGFYEESTTAETNREPLATAFAFRYANDTVLGVSSSVIFWKNYEETYGTEADPADNEDISDCGSYLYYAWDMDERSLSRRTEPISGLPTGGRDPNQFPFETQKVPLTNQYFDLPGDYGWFLLVLPPSYGDFTDPSPNPTWLAGQYPWYFGWAAVIFNWGTYTSGHEAATLAMQHCFIDQVLPALNTYNGAVKSIPTAFTP